MQTAQVDYSTYAQSIPQALDLINASKVLSRQSAVLIKPNLVNASPHPVTTHVDCCQAVIDYVKACSQAEVVVAEGCGDAVLETDEIFDRLGYRRMAQRQGIKLVDLNNAPLVKLCNTACTLFPEIHLPKIAMTHFIISLPVLKAHSLADITGTLKNMIGLAPPKYYSGQYGSWKKARFHGQMHQSIIELNMYRSPDLSVLDASVGLADYHLGGRQCLPPVKKIIAGQDPLALDRLAADLLNLDWKSIPHLVSEIRFEKEYKSELKHIKCEVPKV